MRERTGMGGVGWLVAEVAKVAKVWVRRGQDKGCLGPTWRL